MPIYTYKCKDCEKEMETLRSFARRKEPLICPKCSGQMEYKLSASHWKRGDGWASRMDGMPVPGRG